MGAHDLYFRRVFAVPAHASAELSYVLSPALTERVAWDTLRLEPGTFVDPALTERQTDLLFSARVAGAQGLVYVVYEHQSWPDPSMPFRLAEYVVRILAAERDRRPTEARLPLVIPVVLHHDPAGWTAPRSLAELYDADGDLLDAVGPHALALRIHVDDLATLSTAEILARRAPPVVRAALGLLRDARSLTGEEVLARWGPLLDEVGRAGRQALETAVRYVFGVSETDDRARMLAAARTFGGPVVEEVVMTVGEQLRAEGKADALLQIARNKFGEVDEALERRIRSASAVELHRAIDRVMNVERPEQLFD